MMCNINFSIEHSSRGAQAMVLPGLKLCQRQKYATHMSSYEYFILEKNHLHFPGKSHLFGIFSSLFNENRAAQKFGHKGLVLDLQQQRKWTIRQLCLHSSLNCVCTVLSTVFAQSVNCICTVLSTVFAPFSQLCAL